MHSADAALIANCVAVAEPQHEPVKVQVVEVALANVPPNIRASLGRTHREVEMLLV